MFFNKNLQNTIKFWYYLSMDKWSLHVIVHLDTNIFLFFSFNFDFDFLFIDDEEVCDCGHMTYHMIWCHKV